MATPRARAASKPAPTVTAPTNGAVVFTDPVRSFLVSLHDALGALLAHQPLTTVAAVAVDSPPWDEETPAAPVVADDLDEPAPAPAKKATKAAAKKATPPKATPVAVIPQQAEAPEAEELTAEEYEAELRAMDLEELRALVISLDYDAATVADATVDELVGAALGEKYPETEEVEAASPEPPADDLDDEDAAPAQGEGVTREELVEMNLPTLRQLAKGLDIPEADYMGLDIDSIADLILSYQAGDDLEEDADEGEGEGEEDGYTEDDLRAMSRGDLYALATNPEDHPEVPGYGLSAPKNASPNFLVNLILTGAAG